MSLHACIRSESSPISSSFREFHLTTWKNSERQKRAECGAWRRKREYSRGGQRERADGRGGGPGRRVQPRVISQVGCLSSRECQIFFGLQRNGKTCRISTRINQEIGQFVTSRETSEQNGRFIEFCHLVSRDRATTSQTLYFSSFLF